MSVREPTVRPNTTDDAPENPEPEKLYTVREAELLQLKTGKAYEVIEGELFEMSPTGWKHGRVTFRLAKLLGIFVDSNNLGEILAAETGFELAEFSLVAPDVAYIAKDRINLEIEGFVNIAPDLAVEVHSPSNTAPEMQQKVDLYYKMGTRLVWIVFPGARAIHVYSGPNAVRILRDGDVLDGGEVLPGFSVNVGDIFGHAK